MVDVWRVCTGRMIKIVSVLLKPTLYGRHVPPALGMARWFASPFKQDGERATVDAKGMFHILGG